ncbi:site-2 protease family protein [Candidatus Peregrinibacteria bacterium]|nr:site-2 protease family protein [Candidatus Peregrinibacteria bacterium]
MQEFSYFLYFIPALVIAITVHEFSHAWMANYFGDPTARYEGRISLNPLRHMDIVGTLMLFFVGIGWGKPVPVDSRHFRNPKVQGALVALAGPLSNFLTAILMTIPYKYLSLDGSFAFFHFFAFILFRLSILLFLFNLLPIPPLDGSSIFGLFVPDKFFHRYMTFLQENVKYFIAFLFIDIFILGRYLGFSLIGTVMGTLYEFIATFLLLGA